MVAYLFAAELVVVGLLMVSTVRFPSFKKRSNSPNSVRNNTILLVLVLGMAPILRERFFLAFFAAFTLVSLAMNLGWKLGWRGVEPPVKKVREPELPED